MTAKFDWPRVRRITLDDLNDVVVEGIEDFRHAPKYGLSLSLFYIIVGWVLILLVWHLGMPFLAYPLAMGFALLAPFGVASFYAVSDLREKEEIVTWNKIYLVLKKVARRDLGWMALVMGFALVLWLEIAAVPPLYCWVNQYV